MDGLHSEIALKLSNLIWPVLELELLGDGHPSFSVSIDVYCNNCNVFGVVLTFCIDSTRAEGGWGLGLNA